MPSISDSFYEPNLEQWRQGDVIDNFHIGQESIPLAVLATPQCDITWGKADYFLFVPVGDFGASFLKIVDPDEALDDDTRSGLVELSKSKLSTIFNHVLRNLNGDYAHRFYYLPPYNTIPTSLDASYLDFQKIFTLSQEKCELMRNNRILTVRDPFRSQIFTRYVSYLGRIGTPDFEREDVYFLLQNSKLLFKNEDLDAIWKKRFKSRDPYF